MQDLPFVADHPLLVACVSKMERLCDDVDGMGRCFIFSFKHEPQLFGGAKDVGKLSRNMLIQWIHVDTRANRCRVTNQLRVSIGLISEFLALYVGS